MGNLVRFMRLVKKTVTGHVRGFDVVLDKVIAQIRAVANPNFRNDCGKIVDAAIKTSRKIFIVLVLLGILVCLNTVEEPVLLHVSVARLAVTSRLFSIHTR